MSASRLRQFAAAQVSSGIATAVDWVAVAGLILSGVHYLVASVAGALLGAASDFAIKKRLVFGARRIPLAAAIARYAGVSGASALLNLGLAFALVDGLHVPALPGTIAASLVVGVAFNYPLHKRFVFAGQAPA